MKKWVRTCVCLFAAAAPAVAAADDAGTADSAVDSAASVLKPSLVYDGSALGVLRGGERRGHSYLGSLHLRLAAVAPAESAWAGTSAYVDVRNLQGTQPIRWVGDAQGVSNIAGPPGTDIDEMWVQHNFSAVDASLLAGIYDINTEFYRLSASSLFLNSSFGVGPEFAQSGVEGPSIFPRTAFGVRLAAKPADGIVLRAALLDGVPVVAPDGSRGAFRPGDGLLGVAEAAFLSRPSDSTAEPSDPQGRLGRMSGLPPYQDKLAFGAWHYTAQLPRIEAPTLLSDAGRAGSSGAYAIAERRLIGRDDASGPRLSSFVQLGVASAATNRFGQYVGAGLVGTGWVRARPEDQIGFAVAHARNGSHYSDSQLAQGLPVRPAETTWELSYLTQLAPWIAVQPDLQYVVHPDTDPALRNAWVVQLRFEFAF